MRAHNPNACLRARAVLSHWAMLGVGAPAATRPRGIQNGICENMDKWDCSVPFALRRHARSPCMCSSPDGLMCGLRAPSASSMGDSGCLGYFCSIQCSMEWKKSRHSGVQGKVFVFFDLHEHQAVRDFSPTDSFSSFSYPA